MLSFARTGTGEPLVLIHGVGHFGAGWAPVTERLAADFDVVAVDSPGFGASADLPAGEAHTIERYADAFEAFFAELGLDRPHVAGNSMGGGIVLELARRRAVRSTTAISPVGFWTPRERAWCQAYIRLNTRLPAAARPAIRAAARSGPGRVALLNVLFAHPERMPADAAVAMLENAWASPATEAALDGFDAYAFHDGHELRGTPVTVAWGSKDRLLPFARQAPRARRALPAARHVTLPGLGHTPPYDDPDVVADTIRAGTRAPA